MDSSDDANPVAALLFILGGTIWGQRYDPSTWILLVFCVVFGALRWRPFAPLIVAGLAASINIYEIWMTRSIRILLALLVLAVASWGAARLIANTMMVRRRGSANIR
jgi:hypothetical protein